MPEERDLSSFEKENNPFHINPSEYIEEAEEIEES
jgi:hypothetical protein